MYKKITLDNGVRIVCENIPYVRSVSLGIWVNAGARNETRDNNGISHLVEHMLFKGTKKRSAKKIAEDIDNIGGQLNAFTGKECTCYYIKVLDSHVDVALDVLSDMFFNSKFDEKDIKLEKNVVIEEISMYEDSPEELVHDVLSEIAWDGNCLSYPILGTKESLAKINRDTIKSYIKESYRPERCVISVAGNFNNEIIESIKRYFENWQCKVPTGVPVNKAEFNKNIKIKEKDTEQVHLCLGLNGIEHGNDKLYSLLAVNNIFGGGMSSRIFQKIREERGLAYSVYSYPSSYKYEGLMTIYAGMNPDALDEVMKLLLEEINLLIDKGISESELQKSKEQLKGNYILGLESTSSRMHSIGKSELMLGKFYTPDQILQKIDSISIEKTKLIIQDIFNIDKMSISAVGNIKEGYDFNKYF